MDQRTNTPEVGEGIFGAAVAFLGISLLSDLLVTEANLPASMLCEPHTMLEEGSKLVAIRDDPRGGRGLREWMSAHG